MATSKLNSVFSDLISSLVPANGRINSYLSLILNDRKVVSLTTRTLKTLLALWIVSRVNHALNMWARNHWCFRKPGQPWDFSGDKEIAVVTGGSSGFGLLIAKGLSRHCRVAVLDVQSPPEDLQSCTPYHPKWNSWDTLADTVVLGSNITFYHCDLASASAIHETADAIRRDIGDPSILVNNAGMARYNKLIEEEDDYVEKIFKVNIISHFILIKEFLPIMLKQEKGHIVSIASVGSYISGPPVVDYCATKASVLALHEGQCSTRDMTELLLTKDKRSQGRVAQAL